MELAPGTVLLNKYRVDEVLGVGGMGKVVRASHLYLQQSVAIKLLLPHMADSASTVTRFLREAQATVNLKSEHIARVHDVGTMPASGETPPLPFMVMEYLEGNDLNQILRHHGPQSPPVVCDLMLQACEGIAEAHAMGIVHRDIKPSNFFITRRADGTMLLKILDFGISKTPEGITELTGTQTVLGTPTYMAPEQMKTSKGAEPRSDIWSLGVVMYQLITGRPPFSGESYAELVLKVNTDPPGPIMVPLPPGLGEVIMRCLEKNPARRPQNVGELARSLAPFSTDPITAAASSARSTRILQHRMSQRGVDALPFTATGGRATPVPIQPSQLTPRSWPPTSSSVSHGAGQVTHKVRGGRGFLIAGIAGLVILAGAGGFIASRMLAGDGSSSSASAASSQTPASPPPSSSDSKAVDTKAVDTKAVDTKAMDSKAVDSKAVDSKAVGTTDSKAVDSKAVGTTDSKAVDAKGKTVDTKVDAKTVDTKVAGTTDSKAVDSKSKTVDTKAVDAKTVDTKTVDTKTVDTKTTGKTVDTKTVDTKTVDTKAVDTKAVDAKAVDAKATTGTTKAVDTKPKTKVTAKTDGKSTKPKTSRTKTKTKKDDEGSLFDTRK